MLSTNVCFVHFALCPSLTRVRSDRHLGICRCAALHLGSPLFAIADVWLNWFVLFEVLQAIETDKKAKGKIAGRLS